MPPWPATTGAPRASPSTQRRARFLHVVGRLAPAASVEKAQAEFDLLAGQLAAAYPDANAERGIRVVPLLETVVSDVRAQLWFLFGAAMIVLGIIGFIGLAAAILLPRQPAHAVDA